MNQVATTKAEGKQFNQDEDYYKILGLNCDCTIKDIKGAYKRLANEHHPDKDGDAIWFHLIKEAYVVLVDPKSRANYDEHGRFTQEEKQTARDYIKYVVEQVVAKIEDLEHVDMVETLNLTTTKNIEQSTVELQKQKKIQKKFEKNEHRTKNEAILDVFKKHKGMAIMEIEAIQKNLRTFNVAAIMLKDYEYHFEQREEVIMPTRQNRVFWAGDER